MFRTIIILLFTVYLFACKKTEPEWVEIITSVTDIDGNEYGVKKLGDQYWTTENLKTTRYSNGDPIMHLTDSAQWAEAVEGAYVFYNNMPALYANYGLLYNAFAATDTRNICPEGWHIPSNDDWKKLEKHMGMTQVQADSMEYRGTNQAEQMKEPNAWADQQGHIYKTGFNALPAGVRSYDGQYDYHGSVAVFWTSTDAFKDHYWNRTISLNNPKLGLFYMGHQAGFSCRCVKD